MIDLIDPKITEILMTNLFTLIASITVFSLFRNLDMDTNDAQNTD